MVAEGQAITARQAQRHALLHLTAIRQGDAPLLDPARLERLDRPRISADKLRLLGLALITWATTKLLRKENA
jgi:hypothetical protein